MVVCMQFATCRLLRAALSKDQLLECCIKDNAKLK